MNIENSWRSRVPARNHARRPRRPLDHAIDAHRSLPRRWQSPPRHRRDVRSISPDDSHVGRATGAKGGRSGQRGGAVETRHVAPEARHPRPRQRGGRSSVPAPRVPEEARRCQERLGPRRDEPRVRQEPAGPVLFIEAKFIRAGFSCSGARDRARVHG